MNEKQVNRIIEIFASVDDDRNVWGHDTNIGTKEEVKKEIQKVYSENIDDRCVHCKSEPAYSEEYDSYYCPKCLQWKEPICPDRDCEFCSKRPKYPEE